MKKQTNIYLVMAFGLMLFFIFSCDRATQKINNKSEKAQKFIEVLPESAGMSSERLARIDSVFHYYIEKKWIPGAVVLIARHGKIAYYKSYGMNDIEAGIEIKKDDIFRIASMTKAITSVAVMMLYEEGHFLLDDPVLKYIPEFKNPEILVEVNKEDSTYTSRATKKKITIRHLLSHTSGIGYGFIHPGLKILYDKEGIPDGFITSDAILGDKIKALAKMPLLHEPGEQWTYGLNTDVLGYLVEVISGKTFEEFLHERIFKPLDMNDIHFFLPEEKIYRLVTLYAEENDEGVKKSTVKEYNYPVEGGKSYFSGGAGLSSTALDYAKFLQMLLNNGSYNGTRILSRKTIDLMITKQIGNLWGNSAFGLGFGITTKTDAIKKTQLSRKLLVGWLF